MFFSVFYEICLIFLAVCSLPKFFYGYFFQGKYRNSFLNRLGSGFPLIKKGERPLIWVHAVSLGETKAVTALTRLLKAQYNNPIILFSTATETGWVEACRTIQADYHAFLPFDFSWVIKPIVMRTKPDLVVLCESDFWLNFLKSSKEVGAHVVLVNGKLSTRSLERFQKFSFFSKKMFSYIDQFCVQSNLYKRRFELLGVPLQKIYVTGNMKFDGDYARLPLDQLAAWRKELGIQPEDPVVVIGSSHHPEETQLLKAMQTVWGRFPHLKVLMVPRHPERFNEVAGMLQKSNMSFRRLSNKTEATSTPVVLIDAMGLLRKCYQLADLAIVAGSYSPKVGGHNILEPSWYGVPVLFGPHMHSQPDMVDLVEEYGAGYQVSLESLPEMLINLLDDKDLRKSLGSAGLNLSADVHGATKKTLQLINRNVLNKKKTALKRA